MEMLLQFNLAFVARPRDFQRKDRSIFRRGLALSYVRNKYVAEFPCVLSCALSKMYS